MKDSVDLKTTAMRYKFKGNGIEVDEEALINSNPLDCRKRKLQEKIDVAFNEKVMHDPILRNAIAMGVSNDISELYSLKKLVVVLLDEKEQQQKGQLERHQLSTAPIIFAHAGGRWLGK